MPSPEIIPAILAKGIVDVQGKLAVLGSMTPWIQLDVLDGYFASNTSWHDASEFNAIETSVLVELHLMVRDPESVIRDWSREGRARRAIWHIEIPIDHQRLIGLCRSIGWECGLALSPNTAIPAVAPYLSSIDEVLVMGVQPGFSGQPLLLSTFDRLKHIQRLAPNVLIGLDGGVTLENAAQLLAAGVDRLCVASAIFQAKDPVQALLALKKLTQAAERV